MSNQKITWGKPLVEFGKTGAMMKHQPNSLQCLQQKRTPFF